LAALYTEQCLPDLKNEDPEAVLLFQEFMEMTRQTRDASGAFMVQIVPDQINTLELKFVKLWRNTEAYLFPAFFSLNTCP
jgi:hypothetical protein